MDFSPLSIPLFQYRTIPRSILRQKRLALLPVARIPTTFDDFPSVWLDRRLAISLPSRASSPVPKQLNLYEGHQISTRHHSRNSPLCTVIHFSQGSQIRLPSPPNPPHTRRGTLHGFLPPRCFPRYSAVFTVHSQAFSPRLSLNRQYQYRDCNDNITPNCPTDSDDLSPRPTHEALSQPATFKVSRACTIYDDCWFFDALS